MVCVGSSDIAVADCRARVGRDEAPCDVPVEAAAAIRADGGVEGAAGFFGDEQGEPDGFEKNRADRHRDAGLRAELHQFAVGVEAGAAAFDFVEPAEGAIDGGSAAASD